MKALEILNKVAEEFDKHSYPKEHSYNLYLEPYWYDGLVEELKNPEHGYELIEKDIVTINGYTFIAFKKLQNSLIWDAVKYNLGKYE